MKKYIERKNAYRGMAILFFSVALVLIILLLLLNVDVRNVLAKAYYQATSTLSPTVTITAPPPYQPAIGGTNAMGAIDCPLAGTPIVDYGTLTPSMSWWALCGNCVKTPLVTSTVVPSKTATHSGTGTAYPTGTSSPTLTNTVVPTTNGFCNELLTATPTINLSATSTPSSNTTWFQENDAALVYSGSWSRVFDDYAQDDYVMLYQGQDDDGIMELTYVGGAVQIYYVICPSCGKFNVYMDGVFQTTKDTYAGSWSTEGYNISPTVGNHVFRIESTGTKNTNSTGYDIRLDRGYRVLQGNTATPRPIGTINSGYNFYLSTVPHEAHQNIDQITLSYTCSKALNVQTKELECWGHIKGYDNDGAGSRLSVWMYITGTVPTGTERYHYVNYTNETNPYVDVECERGSCVGYVDDNGTTLFEIKLVTWDNPSYQGWIEADWYMAVSLDEFTCYNYPTPNPNVTPQPFYGGYCGSVKDTDLDDSAFSWSGIAYSEERTCFDIGPYEGFDFWGLGSDKLMSYGWLAHICLQDVSFGQAMIFGVELNLDIIIYVLGIAWLIRNLFVS